MFHGMFIVILPSSMKPIPKFTAFHLMLSAALKLGANFYKNKYNNNKRIFR
jgi:hypothetical protein